DDEEDKDEEVHDTSNVETKDTLAPKPLSSSPPKSFSQTERKHIKKDKGKKFMSWKDAKEESSDGESDDTVNLIGSKVETLRMKKLNKLDFITEYGDHVHLTEEQIKEQKAQVIMLIEIMPKNIINIFHIFTF
nr:hypothetical protein [Tanacetum cinerariifolium]